MLKRGSFCGLLALLLWGCDGNKAPLVVLQAPQAPAQADQVVRKEVRRLAFGSCAAPRDSMPVLRVAQGLRPDVFVWLGDNVYGDTDNMDTLQSRYAALSETPDFQALKADVRMMATWDDHDYGLNDAGRHFAQKDASKDVFLSFWEEPRTSPRRTRPGVYTSTLFDGARADVHVILLDTRTFRDDLRPGKGMELVAADGTVYAADWIPHEGADSTLLGAPQWDWLEAQLAVPCDIRVIGTSTQFGVAYNGYESWANFPHEQRRMVALLEAAAASRLAEGDPPVATCFISGDVHYAEASRMTLGADGQAVPESLAPIWDITSSGITSTWSFATQNTNRAAGPVMENNIGLLRFMDNDSSLITAEIWDATGERRILEVAAPR